MSSLGIKIERTDGFSHCPEISITGLAPGEYSVFLNGERTGKVTADASGAVYVGSEEASGGTVLSVEITADPTKLYTDAALFGCHSVKCTALRGLSINSERVFDSPLFARSGGS